AGGNSAGRSPDCADGRGSARVLAAAAVTAAGAGAAVDGSGLGAVAAPAAQVDSSLIRLGISALATSTVDGPGATGAAVSCPAPVTSSTREIRVTEPLRSPSRATRSTSDTEVTGRAPLPPAPAVDTCASAAAE